MAESVESIHQRVRSLREEATEALDDTAPGKAVLVPLPAVRRRKGLTAIRGLFQGLPAVLDVVQDGLTREELKIQLRKDSPTAKDNTLNAIINCFQSELAVIRREGDQYVLTERGEALLESNDPDELADWMLTHILGVDHIVWMVAEAM